MFRTMALVLGEPGLAHENLISRRHSASPEDINSLFTRFNTSGRKNFGSGLGLYRQSIQSSAI